MELHRFSIQDILVMMNAKEISAREVVEYFLRRIDLINPDLNAIVSRNDQQSLALAQIIDNKRASGEFLPVLAGIPFGVKDLERVSGFPTTYGSKLYATAEPSMSNSYLVQRFMDLGAIPIAKTNTSEFGWKATTDNAVFGHTRNPYDIQRSSGGSSGGTAAAVSAGIIPFGTGSDGGGSIRIPSSACGIPGLKTTPGRIASSISHAPEWWELATGGPITRGILSTAWLYDLCVENDPLDMTSIPTKNNDWACELTAGDSNLKVAISKDLGYWSTDKQILVHLDNVAEILSNHGYDVIEVANIFDEQPYLTWAILTKVYLARKFASILHTENFAQLEDGLQDMILEGTKISGIEFVSALDKAWSMHRDYFGSLKGANVLITPTTAGLAPLIGMAPTINSLATSDWVSFTSFANLLRIPAISVPVGMTSDLLPVSVQIHGPRFGETTIMRLAKFIEEHTEMDFPNKYY